MLLTPRSFHSSVRAGSSFSGYDDTSSDNSTADAADPPAASPEPSAAPGSSPAATGPHVTAGNVRVAAVTLFSDEALHCFEPGRSQFGIKLLSCAGSVSQPLLSFLFFQASKYLKNFSLYPPLSFYD